MAILFDLPSEEDLDQHWNITVLAAALGLNDIEFDYTLSKGNYIDKGFVEVDDGLAPICKQYMRRDIQAESRHYELRH
eukprot:13812520-Ditylum_brightwellii.AAC.1